MLFEGVVVNSKLDLDTPEALTFDVLKEDSLVTIHIPAGDMRESMMDQAKTLQIGEKIDVYVFLRDWDYEVDGEKRTGTIYYARGITHYDA